MLSAIWNYILDHYPVLGIVIFIAVVFGWVIWKCAMFYSKTQNAVKDLPDIKSTLQKIHTGLIALNNLLLEREVIKQSCYSDVNSPRVVNALGKKLFSESGAETIFESMKNDFISELEKQKIVTLLQLEQSSLQLLLEKISQPEFRALQDFAFQNPKFNSNPLTLTDILFVMSLFLRDAYREKHPELKIE